MGRHWSAVGKFWSALVGTMGRHRSALVGFHSGGPNLPKEYDFNELLVEINNGSVILFITIVLLR